jgi:Ca2+-binding RTX toxin-like protein
MTGGPEDAVAHYLMGATPDGADRVLGGAGFDVAGYSLRTAPLLLAPDGVANDGEAGEGDDLGAAVERLEGGAGADRLIAAGGLDAELSGEDGADQLAGGAGADLLSGGDGDDGLSGAGGDDLAAPSDPVAVPDDDAQPGEGAGSTGDAGADAFTGGVGVDTMSYATRTGPVSASLNGVADDGEAGERDDVGNDVEVIEGGAAADTLSGRNGPQRLVGGAGGDLIDPGPGLDDVNAGGGDDTVRARDGTPEWITCGDGTDTLSGDAGDVPVGCERTTLAAGTDRRRPRVRMDSLPRRPRYRHVQRGLRPRLTADEPVSYVVELRGVARSAHISAAAPFNLTLVRKTLKRTARPRRVTLRPRIALLGPRRKLRVRIRVTAKDAAGNVRVIARTIKARR